MTLAPSQLSSRPDLQLFRIYGVSVAAPPEFGVEFQPACTPPDVTVDVYSTSQAPSDPPVQWYHAWRARDGSRWLSAGRDRDGWYSLRAREGGFRISPDGRRIQAWPLDGFQPHDLRHRVLNQVLPMVLNLLGSEVLHASSVCDERSAVAFVGNGGYGKSTLAAAMIRQGFSLLSDDAVPLRPRGKQVWTSHGPPEIGLWSGARCMLVDSPHSDTPVKASVRLDPPRYRCGEFPLVRLYFLQPSAEPSCVQVRALAPRQCLMELVRAAHRMDVTDSAMLRRQTKTLHHVAGALPARVLSYPEGLPNPGEVIAAVLADLTSDLSWAPKGLAPRV